MFVSWDLFFSLLLYFEFPQWMFFCSSNRLTSLQWFRAVVEMSLRNAVSGYRSIPRAPWSWSNLPSHQRLKIIGPNEGLPSGHCTYQISLTKWPPSMTLQCHRSVWTLDWLDSKQQGGWPDEWSCMLIAWDCNMQRMNDPGLKMCYFVAHSLPFL